MENGVYPDQLASLEASWSGSTMFSKKDTFGFNKRMIKQTVSSCRWPRRLLLDIWAVSWDVHVSDFDVSSNPHWFVRVSVFGPCFVMRFLYFIFFSCIVTVRVLWLFLTVPRVGLQCVIAVCDKRKHRLVWALTTRLCDNNHNVVCLTCANPEGGQGFRPPPPPPQINHKNIGYRFS